MQLYQFEKIYSQMEKEFGAIQLGEEAPYADLLLPIEGNLLKAYRQNPASNSRRLREAIALALYTLKSNYTGEEFLLDKFRDKDNGKLEHTILMTFDPLANSEIRMLLAENPKVNLEDPESLKAYYARPILCLLRIKASVDIWEKRIGPNGYFESIESIIGTEISGNEMEIAVPIEGQ